MTVRLESGLAKPIEELVECFIKTAASIRYEAQCLNRGLSQWRKLKVLIYKSQKTTWLHLTTVQIYDILYGKSNAMRTSKMTVRVPKELLERAKQYARENDTTLTRLITTYLGQLGVESDPIADAPIVRRLMGTLSQEIGVEDYRQHLEDKYGHPN